FVFAAGVFLSNVVFNPLIMIKPFTGSRVGFSGYLRGSLKDHLLGVVGGAIWCFGMLLSIIASYEAGAAISYGLASGAIIIASLWGIFFWREFKGAQDRIQLRLNVMLISFLFGLILIVIAR
ncbi:GRP family sugar transporter, partial [Dyadobacter sp. SG02]|uniref:GRP family sugar transporter n=1 Tax=Dyadobacter sp. SG02 TaxID=1855291 RepID=UPI001C433D48